ncbi:MAG: hypothetical protein MJZ27_04455 [Bacteroidales bacterium]|nr:hypothetical protein [Bacteroidales bacterium]
MNKFVCETCGSSNLLKQDGLYMCEYCRTKYTVEEVKKLFVEVAINHDEEVKELYTAASRELETRNWEAAHETFKHILSLCPNDWEAIFYSEITKTLRDGRESFPHNVVPLCKAINEALHIIQKETDDNDQDDNIATITKLVIDLSDIYFIDTKKTEKLLTFDSADTIQYRNLIYTSCMDLCYYYGDILHGYFGDRYKNTIVQAWKQGVTIQNNSNIKKCQFGTASEYEAKIQKYEPNWSFEENGKKEVKKNDNVATILTILGSIAVIYCFSEFPITYALVATVFILVILTLVFSYLSAIINAVAIFVILISLIKLPSSTCLPVILLTSVTWYFIHKYLKKKEKECAVDIEQLQK